MTAPEGLFDAMVQVSPFLSALQSELCSLSKVSASCYSQVKQQLAAVGQYLPPAADSSSRRSSSSSNGPSSSTDLRNSSGSGSSSSDSYYGRGLDLQQLQQQTDDASLKLIQLEDGISSSAAALARLAQQYDIMITAALAAAEQHADAAAVCLRPGEQPGRDAAPITQQQQGEGLAGEAGPGRQASRKGSSFLGPLFESLRFHKPSGDAAKLSDHQQKTQQQADADIEYVFMVPGVCSHSNDAQTYKFTAGEAGESPRWGMQYRS